MNLEKLFSPKSIAILGASEEEGKVGNVITKNVLTLGYSGEVFLVNPKHENLFGRKCFKSLSEIEKNVDLAVVAIPAKFVSDEIKNNAEKIKNWVVISAGFSEIGEDGKAREKELQEIAHKNSLNILGPNCLGFVSPKEKLNASFAGGLPDVGNIAFVSQSGALAVAIMDAARERHLKFSRIVSVGNKAVLSEAEMLDFLAEDEKTKVIGMYLEGIKNGKEFMQAASRVSAKKPVVILKAGKTEKSQKAISSHTGALAGSDEIISAVFEKTGITRAENLEDFFNLLNLMSLTDAPKNSQTVVITNAGGPGVLATDAFKNKNIVLSEIPEKTKRKLRKFLPEESSVENPIDLLGDAKEDRYKKVLEIVNKDVDPGSILTILTPQDQTPVLRIASKIIQFKNKTGADVVASFLGGEKVEKAIRKLRENGVPVFNFPEEAVSSLNKYYLWKKHPSNNSASFKTNIERREKVKNIMEKAKRENRTALYFSEAREIMGFYGIPVIRSVEIENNISSVSSFPVVLKVDSDKVLHKTDKKGLALDIQNQEELEKSVSEMRKNFPEEKLIVQPMLPRQTELIIGIKKDQIFGPIVVFGLGGIYTEVFKMVEFLIPSVDLEEIKDKILNSRIKFLFGETRGQAAYDAHELAEILLGVGLFALEAESVKEFDINPLLIYNNKKTAVAVDVKIII